MAAIRWTEQALADLEAISEYIARDSLAYAKLHVKTVFDAVQRLGLFPESGRVVPEFEKSEIREIILGNYRIIYRYSSDLVEILTVYHSSRLLNDETVSS
jgi:addiction module RelE/StbE family toxin